MWEYNARYVENVFGGYVNWEERFYICPECGEVISEEDWTHVELMTVLCPICEFTDEEDN